MKTIKSLVLIAALAFSTAISANANPLTEAKASSDAKVITTEISKLLQNPSFDVDEELTADVTLTINKNNEIVVLSVDTEDSLIEGYIKSRLNYNELPSSVGADEKTFIVPVKIETELY